MGIFDIFKRKQKTNNRPLILYSEVELDEYDSYIQACLGTYDKVYHELVSDVIHLDVIPIPPTEDCPYIKLVTMGAGAYRMNVPESFAKFEMEYAEYIIYVPKDWNLDSADEKDYWPMRALKSTARLPISSDTWLGYGHTVSMDAEGTPYAENTKLNCILLVNALDQYGRRMKLKMSTGKTINFYQLVPIYGEELAYKQEHGSDALVDLLCELPDFPAVDIDRKNVIIDSCEEKGEEER